MERSCNGTSKLMWSRRSAAVLISLIVAGAAVAGNDPLGQSGAPRDASPGNVSHAQPVIIPAGFDDPLQPVTEEPAVREPSALTLDKAESVGQRASISISDRLAAFDQASRANAVIALELPGDATAETREQAREVESLWNGGSYDEALLALAILEGSGPAFAVGVDWREPVGGSQCGRGMDVRIGDPRTDAELTVLDYDAQNGHLFAVVQWADGWSVNMSTDGGATWVETFFWVPVTGYGVVDLDAAVVDQYLYVGYVGEEDTSEGRLRRHYVSDGSSDTSYYFHVVLDSAPETIVDVAVASNADDYDNRIYYCVIQSNSLIRWFWDYATVGQTFTEESPGNVNAAGGLDMHWNEAYTNWWMFVSYIGTDGAVHVLRFQSVVWEDSTVQAVYSGYNLRTALSAHADNVICAYEHQYTNGRGIRYQISYDAGGGWSGGTIIEPNPGEGSYVMTDVTARGGAGTAAIYTQEVGKPDNVFFRNRLGYAPGPWNPQLQFNDYDVVTGTWTAINWLRPPLPNPGSYRYGMIYLSGAVATPYPYFDRVSRCAGDFNGDGYIGLSDLATLLAHYGMSGMSYEDGDMDGDGYVGLPDLGALLAVYGRTCQ